MKPLKRWAKRLIKRLKHLSSLKRNKRRMTYIISAFLILGLGIGWRVNHVRAEHQKQELRTSLHSLTTKLQDSQKATTSTKQQLDEKKASEDALKAQIEDLNKQLQAKAEQKSLLAQVAQTITQKVYAEPLVGATNCGDNMYKQYIYSHESSCNTASANSHGCFGVGQDCNGIVRSQCGTDFSCQDAYFSSYAVSRYGSWAGAYSAWLSKGWW